MSVGTMKVLTILMANVFITNGFYLFTESDFLPKCLMKTCEGEIILIPNIRDCSSYWIWMLPCNCVYSIPQFCPYGKLFDKEELSCVEYENALCASGIKPPPPFTTTTKKPTTTTTSTTTTEKPTTTTTSTTTTKKPTTTTTTEKSTTTTTEKPTTTTSTTTTEKYTTTSTKKPTTTTSTTTTEKLTTTSLPPGNYPVYCPPQLGPNDNYLVPNPEDCYSFYQCVYGVPYLHHCPANLCFNPDESVCDYPKKCPGCVKH